MPNNEQLLLLIHIFVLGVPMVGASVFLLVVTLRIRGLLGRYRIQMTVFRGILLAGYLFILIAVAHIFEETLEWYGYDYAALEVGALWHAATLIVLLILSYSFYQYLRVLRQSEKTD